MPVQPAGMNIKSVSKLSASEAACGDQCGCLSPSSDSPSCLNPRDKLLSRHPAIGSGSDLYIFWKVQFSSDSLSQLPLSFFEDDEGQKLLTICCCTQGYSEPLLLCTRGSDPDVSLSSHIVGVPW